MSQKYIEIPRHLHYLNDKRIVYRRDPINDLATLETPQFKFYENGTYECYHLFNSKAKINTYKSLTWHLLVLWYLNPQLNTDDFTELARTLALYEMGFITFFIPPQLLEKIINNVKSSDLDEPPKNKLRKVIFKPYNNLDLKQKLKIVGKLIGRSKLTKETIANAMLEIHYNKEIITVSLLAKICNCSTRTIHRNINNKLKNKLKSLNEKI
tara:strand:- start:806 stop:1438 length:633 start_codon:yes stop_codon:yes gene_type:complete